MKNKKLLNFGYSLYHLFVVMYLNKKLKTRGFYKIKRKNLLGSTLKYHKRWNYIVINKLEFDIVLYDLTISFVLYQGKNTIKQKTIVIEPNKYFNIMEEIDIFIDEYLIEKLNIDKDKLYYLQKLLSKSEIYDSLYLFETFLDDNIYVDYLLRK
jgi:hypothetical protein